MSSEVNTAIKIPPQKFVVENFDGASVSWASTYVEHAINNGYDTLKTTSADTIGHRIFLGDKLPRQLGSGGVTMYFLAAVDGLALEQDSSFRTDITLTVSEAEKRRLLNFFPEIGESTVHVDGFPVLGDTKPLSSFDREGRSVAFLGRAHDDKGPDLELELASRLVEAGFNVHHFSNTVIPIADELQAKGVRVHEGVRGPAYLKALSQMSAVVNTSPRESLFVAGIEATSLGVPVLAVQNSESGIWDWNRPDRAYNPTDIDTVVDQVATVIDQGPGVELPDVSRYRADTYFAALDKRLEAYHG